MLGGEQTKKWQRLASGASSGTGIKILQKRKTIEKMEVNTEAPLITLPMERQVEGANRKDN